MVTGQQNLHNVIAEAVRRSAVDMEFRQLALKDGNAALRKVSTGQVPAGTDVVFIEELPNTSTIVLPNVVDGLEELSEGEMLKVAGGSSPTIGGTIKITW